MAGSDAGIDVAEFIADVIGGKDLKHYGVKGMKWGVRKDRGHEGERATNKKIAKLDKKFAQEARSLSTTIKLHNRAASLTNENDVGRINSKPQYKGVDFNRDSPLRRKYYAEHQKAFLDNLEKAASEAGSNASGTKRYGIREGANGRWDVILRDAQHADEDVMTIQLTRDALGHITALSIVKPEELVQAEVLIDELKHYGIKGMKWGVRRRSGDRGPAVERRPKSSDHVEAQVLKKKRPSEMSNAELRRLNERMNLEQNYSRLMQANPSKFSKGAKMTQEILKTAGQAYNTYNSPLVKELRKSLSNLN